MGMMYAIESPTTYEQFDFIEASEYMYELLGWEDTAWLEDVLNAEGREWNASHLLVWGASGETAVLKVPHAQLYDDQIEGIALETWAELLSNAKGEPFTVTVSDADGPTYETYTSFFAAVFLGDIEDDRARLEQENAELRRERDDEKDE